jgi:hypothetical protein
MHFLHDAKNRKISKNIVDSEQSICAVAPFLVVAPCPTPQKLHTPPCPTTGFRTIRREFRHRPDNGVRRDIANILGSCEIQVKYRFFAG